MESFRSKRPTFNQVRDWFIEEAKRHTSMQIDNTYIPWTDVGSEKLREEIVELFMKTLENRYGFRPIFEQQLHALDGSMESVINQIYHVFSTMFLVDHINNKMYKEQQKKMN